MTVETRNAKRQRIRARLRADHAEQDMRLYFAARLAFVDLPEVRLSTRRMPGGTVLVARAPAGQISTVVGPEYLYGPDRGLRMVTERLRDGLPGWALIGDGNLAREMNYEHGVRFSAAPELIERQCGPDCECPCWQMVGLAPEGEDRCRDCGCDQTEETNDA